MEGGRQAGRHRRQKVGARARRTASHADRGRRGGGHDAQQGEDGKRRGSNAPLHGVDPRPAAAIPHGDETHQLQQLGEPQQRAYTTRYTYTSFNNHPSLALYNETFG